jgi:4-oxalomesaconate tautomerase
VSAAADGIACMQMRGGSSKGAYFLSSDLPADPAERDDLLLRIMGSPDPREIDGIGGGHPLTSKVAVVSRSAADDADVDFLFLQVLPEKAVVTDKQTCGNLLSGVGPFAIERGLVPVNGDTTGVRIRIMNPVISRADARVQTPDGRVRYDGTTVEGDIVMAGTPFPAAPIRLVFPGDDHPVFPTGNLVDHIAGLDVTCVNAGMPVVLLRAADLGLDGTEAPHVLEADASLRARLEKVRLNAGPRMGLGEVGESTVPKMTIVSEPRNGGAITTRTFIPHRVHDAIGVLGAVSVAAAVRAGGTVADPCTTAGSLVRVEHPTGTFPVTIDLDGAGAATRVHSSGVVRTARKLADGLVWPRAAQGGSHAA